MTRRAPSYQLLSPSEAMRERTATESAMETSSNGSNPRVSLVGPRNRDAKTRRGATNRAICVLELVQIPTLRSILFRQAIITDAPCSAAFPMIATTTTPANRALSPAVAIAPPRAPTRISLSTPTRAVAPRRIPSANRTLQRGGSSSALTGLNTSRCVWKENTRPAMYATRRIAAIRMLILSTVGAGAGTNRLYSSGITRAMTASVSIVTWRPAAARLNDCLGWRTPPASMLTPRTRRMFPMIEPVIDALTTSTSPPERATRAMISSVAFPNVAFSRPPRPGPARLPSSSVARPITYASGTIAIPAERKTANGFELTAHTTALTGTRRKNGRTRRERTRFVDSATGGQASVPRYQPAAPQTLKGGHRMRARAHGRGAAGDGPQRGILRRLDPWSHGGRRARDRGGRAVRVLDRGEARRRRVRHGEQRRGRARRRAPPEGRGPRQRAPREGRKGGRDPGGAREPREAGARGRRRRRAHR